MDCTRGHWPHGALLVALALTFMTPGPGARAEAVQRVLFIGNSLTSVNHVPGLVQALARARDGDTIDCHMVAVDGFSLEDHWKQGDAARAIARGGWTTVVLQQGPSALPESRVLLREFTRRFDGEVRRIGARTALYMVWPSTQRRADFDGVTASYTAAARDVGGILLPAGEAWRAAWRRDRTLALYGRDGLHPTPLGSYLAALVIYQKLTGQSPVGLPSTLRSDSGAFRPLVLTPDEARLAQLSAADAVAAFPDW